MTSAHLMSHHIPDGHSYSGLGVSWPRLHNTQHTYMRLAEFCLVSGQRHVIATGQLTYGPIRTLIDTLACVHWELCNRGQHTPYHWKLHTHTLSVYDYSTAAPNYTAWSGHGERRHYSAGGTSTDHHLKEKETRTSSLILKCYISHYR